MLSFVTESQVIQGVIDAYAGDIARETLSGIGVIPVPVVCKEVDLDDGVVNISIA